MPDYISVKEAAEECHISQSAISQQIQALEEFSAKYPDVSVKIEYGNHEELCELLRSGGVDLVSNDQRRAFSDEYVNLLLTVGSEYIEISKFIRAWNDFDDGDSRGWTIIDSMLNISLLFWASEESGDSVILPGQMFAHCPGKSKNWVILEKQASEWPE